MRFMTTTIGSAFAATTIGLLIFGPATAAFAARAPETSSTPASVLAFDQKIADGKIEITYAYLPVDGYVVIYEIDRQTKRGDGPLGHTALKAGPHIKFQVPITKVAASGTTVSAVVYSDADDKLGFDNSRDTPLWPDVIPTESRFLIK
jgi:hypothetical protein